MAEQETWCVVEYPLDSEGKSKGGLSNRRIMDSALTHEQAVATVRKLNMAREVFTVAYCPMKTASVKVLQEREQ